MTLTDLAKYSMTRSVASSLRQLSFLFVTVMRIWPEMISVHHRRILWVHNANCNCLLKRSDQQTKLEAQTTKPITPNRVASKQVVCSHDTTHASDESLYVTYW